MIDYATRIENGKLDVGPRAKGKSIASVPVEYEEEIVRLYLDQAHSATRITKMMAEEYNFPISQTAVLGVLRRAGCDTGKGAMGGYREVACTCCGRVYAEYRSRVERHEEHYCTDVCQRIMWEERGLHQMHGRWYIEQLLKKPLPEEAVIHFVDDVFGHIKKSNMKVFLTHARHLREHGIYVGEEEGI